MADLITNIKLNKTQFDNSIQESTNQIRKFKQDTESSGKSVTDFGGKMQGLASGALMKLTGAIGAGVTVIEGFRKVIDATQGTADYFEVTIGATRDTVDQFFKAISSGDFTNFTNGLGDVFERAKKAREELDQLWNTINAVGLAQTKATTKQMKGKDIANDPDLSIEERMKGLELWREGIEEFEAATQTQINDTESTVKAVVNTYNTLKPNQITIPIISEAILVDAKGKPIRDAIKEKLGDTYDEYVKEVERAKKESTRTTYKYTGTPNAYGKQSKSRVTEVDQKIFQPKLNALNEKYKEAIIANSLLNQMTDEQLEDTTNKLKSIEQQQGVIYQQSYQYSKGQQRAINQMNKKDKSSGSNNNKNSEEILPEGTIAYIERQIDDLNKQLKLTVDPETYRDIKNQIRELENEKISLTVDLNYGKANNNVLKLAIEPLTSANPLNLSNKNTSLSSNAARELSVAAEIQDLKNTLKKTQRLANEATGREQKKLLDTVNRLINRIRDLENGNITKSMVASNKSSLTGFGVDINWNDKLDLLGYANSIQTILNELDDNEIKIKFNVSKEELNGELKKVTDKINELESKEVVNQEKWNNWQGAVYDVGDAFGYLGDVMGDVEGRNLKVIGTLISGINQLLPNIITLVAAKGSEAYASAIASGAGLPFPWNIAAIGAGVAAVAANLAAIPKFADGGLVYGNTIAQVGEYSGASSNPEVIAPLSKLRNILEDTGSSGGGTVDFRIKGSDLEGALRNYNSKKRKK